MELQTIANELKQLWRPFRNDADEPNSYAWRARERAEIIAEHRDEILKHSNSNALDADLKRIAFTQEFVREFAIHLSPINLFTTRFDGLLLQGTDKVAVRFYPLQSQASQTYDPSTGYNTASNSATNTRDVLIGGAGPTNSGSNAPANTANNRLYQGLFFDSLTARRQPNFDPMQLNKMNAARLAVDVWSDVVSRVITQANFGNPVITVSGGAFTGDNVADVAHQCNLANWPTNVGRSLVLDSALHTAALKDPAYRTVVSSKAVDEAYGFQDLEVIPNLVSYSPTGENLVGWAAFKSAICFATAPIVPTPEVRHVMAGYEIVTDLETGISLEYRAQGNATLDQSQHIMQCCYGAAVGVASALKRITQQ